MSAERDVGIGHNQPPIAEQLPVKFDDELAFVKRLVERADATPDDVASDEDLEAIVAVVKDCRSTASKLDDLRKATSQPFRDATGAINAFFNAELGRLEEQVTKLSKRVADYNDRKEAERRRALAAEEKRQAAIAREKLEEAANSGSRLEQEIAMDEAERAEASRATTAQVAKRSSAELTRTKTSAGTVSTRKQWTFSVEDYREIPLEELRPYLSTAHIDAALRGFVRANKDTRTLKGVRFYQDSKANIR